MIFWDASAVVPLLVAEASTAGLQVIAGRDAEMLVWWGTEVECASALARLERAGALDAANLALAAERLTELADSWHEVEPSEIVRETALRCLRVHPLRAAGALQLAAALVAAGARPHSLQVLTLDDRLAEAARREGFALVDASVSRA